MKISSNNTTTNYYILPDKQEDSSPQTEQKQPLKQNQITKPSKDEKTMTPDSTVIIPPGCRLVKKGDTLYGISRDEGIPISDIILLNPTLKKDKQGNWIIEENSILRVHPETSIQEETPVEDGQMVYGSWHIENGKGAYSVMSKFNLFREELQTLNPDIDLNNIKKEDVFKVPGYKVKSGDTFESIASTHDITVEMLQAINPTLNGQLKEGSILNVPKRAGQDLGVEDLEVEFDIIEEESPEKITHTVKNGEALSLIAEKYHVPMWAIMLHNNITNENKIYKGQVLEIPSQDEISELEELKNKPAQPPQKEKPQNHKIKSGDTLSEIALKYGITVKELKEWNNLKSDSIQIGKVLRLTKPGQTDSAKNPEQKKETPQVTKYTIKKNDVLSVIAQKYGVSTAAIMYKNNINNPKHIQPGQVLIIPTKDEVSELEKKQKEIKNQQQTAVKQPQKVSQKKPEETPKDKIAQNMGIVIHKVKKGDTLTTISEKYGIPIQDILAYNDNLRGIKSTDNLSEKEIKNLKIIATKKAVIDATGVSQKFIDELIAIEKKRNKMYKDACGIPTIGIGHNTKAHEDTAKYNGVTLSDNQIYSLLARDIIEAQNSIKKSIGKDAFDNLSRGQKEALYGLIFNTGGLNGSPKLIAALKCGDYTTAACEMNQAYGTVNGKKQILPGLAKRRFMDISNFIHGSGLSKSQTATVMKTVQKLYDDGFKNIQRQNTKVDYNAFAKKFLGEYISRGLITLKE